MKRIAIIFYRHVPLLAGLMFGALLAVLAKLIAIVGAA